MAHTLTHPHLGGKYHNEETDDVRRQRGHIVERDMAVARSRFGGFHFGAAFFGWLVSTGLAAILIGILGAAGGALAVTSIGNVQELNATTVSTIGLWSGIVFLIVLAISYYAGGYVAGRLARFDGARQGFGVWVIGVIVTIILALAGAALGAKYNVLQQINLPHIPIKQGAFTTGGWITSVLALIITLLTALAGGRAGMHYHRKVDSAAVVDREV
ncbi:MAG TPA: hypothetical protein VFH39_00520 [Candidatus Saccharimonadales bacterium]|nr:hypothetical protein [Candidatus Saccharimonadales bacterium]